MRDRERKKEIKRRERERNGGATVHNGRKEIKTRRTENINDLHESIQNEGNIRKKHHQSRKGKFRK